MRIWLILWAIKQKQVHVVTKRNFLTKTFFFLTLSIGQLGEFFRQGIPSGLWVGFLMESSSLKKKVNVFYNLIYLISFSISAWTVCSNQTGLNLLLWDTLPLHSWDYVLIFFHSSPLTEILTILQGLTSGPSLSVGWNYFRS